MGTLCKRRNYFISLGFRTKQRGWWEGNNGRRTGGEKKTLLSATKRLRARRACEKDIFKTIAQNYFVHFNIWNLSNQIKSKVAPVVQPRRFENVFFPGRTIGVLIEWGDGGEGGCTSIIFDSINFKCWEIIFHYGSSIRPRTANIYVLRRPKTEKITSIYTYSVDVLLELFIFFLLFITFPRFTDGFNNSFSFSPNNAQTYFL